MIFRLFGRWTGKDQRKAIIDRLHAVIVAGARRPALYTDFAVPDTVEGRFELAVLHTFLVVRRLKTMPAPGPEIAQDLIDRTFAHFELALREIGIGDQSVPKRMKKLAGSFYGRVQAYEAPLAAGDKARLSAALLKNVYAGETSPDVAARLTEEIFRLNVLIESLTLDDLTQGRIDWPQAGFASSADAISKE